MMKQKTEILGIILEAGQARIVIFDKHAKTSRVKLDSQVIIHNVSAFDLG